VTKVVNHAMAGAATAVPSSLCEEAKSPLGAPARKGPRYTI
jgi:hypothetical protein